MDLLLSGSYPAQHAGPCQVILLAGTGAGTGLVSGFFSLSNCPTYLPANSTLITFILCCKRGQSPSFTILFQTFLAACASSSASELACQSSMNYLLKFWSGFLLGRRGIFRILSLPLLENPEGVHCLGPSFSQAHTSCSAWQTFKK